MVLDSDIILLQWLGRRRIHCLSSEQVKLGKVKRTGNTFSKQEAGRQIRLLVCARSIPGVKNSINISHQDPSPIKLCALHSSGRQLREVADLDEVAQASSLLAVLVVSLEKVCCPGLRGFRFLLELRERISPRWNHAFSPHPFFFDEVLNRGPDGSQGNPLDGWV